MIFTFLSKIWLILDSLQKCKTQGEGAKMFLDIVMGYENNLSKFHGVWIFFCILKFHSAPVPGIKTNRSLMSLKKINIIIIPCAPQLSLNGSTVIIAAADLLAYN